MIEKDVSGLPHRVSEDMMRSAIKKVNADLAREGVRVKQVSQDCNVNHGISTESLNAL